LNWGQNIIKEKRQVSHKPGSVSRYKRDGGHLSGSRVSPTLKRSTRRHRPGTASGASLFDLAPTGVCRAGSVARTAGGLLPHRFTLALRLKEPQAVCSLWHFPGIAPPGHYPAVCPAEPGLSSARDNPRPRPPGSPDASIFNIISAKFPVKTFYFSCPQRKNLLKENE